MVTKIITQAQSIDLSISAVNKTIDCKGYKSAKAVFKANGTTGSIQTFLRNESGVAIPIYNSTNNKLSHIGYDYQSGSVAYEYELDLSKASSVVITSSANITGTASLDIYFSYESLNIDEPKEVFSTSGGSKVFKSLGAKYMSFKLQLLEDTMPSTQNVIHVKRSNNGSDWEDAKIIINKELKDYFYITNIDVYDFWLPTLDYKYIKISTDWTALNSYIEVKCDRLESMTRDVVVNGYTQDMSVFGISKFVRFNFNGYHTKNFTGYFSLSAGGLLPIMRDINGNKIVNSERGDIYWVATDNVTPAFRFMNFGEYLHGGFSLEYSEVPTRMVLVKTMYSGTECLFDGIQGDVDLKLSLTLSDEPFESKKEIPVIERKDYDIYLEDVDGKIIDALGEDVLVKVSDTEYRYYRLGLAGVWYNITIDKTHIPSLIDGETIRFAKLVYNSANTYNCNNTRICLFTNKNRILYNRVKGKGTDISYFREAPLYNLVKKFYPVNSKEKAVNGGKYLPIFPDYDYDQFNGRVGGTDEFGLVRPSRGEVGSLLEDFRKPNATNALGKLCYSNFVNSDTHGCFWGNYNLMDADPFIAVTDNGSAWYIVRELACVEDFSRSGLTTQRVDLSTIISNAGGYVADSLKLTWRKYNVPTDVNKEPSNPFVIKGSAIVKSITVQNNETLITFEDDSLFYADQYDRYRFQEFAPVVFFENVNAGSEYDYICNSCKADGSDNTGVFFRLQLVSGHTYKLWGDVGNPFEGEMVCRHIHSVSESSSGFLVATGENYWDISGNGAENADMYEGGFLYYLPANGRNDTTPVHYSIDNAKGIFGNMFRISSSKNGVNRACGAYLKTDNDNTIIYVSDDCQRKIKRSNINGRTSQLMVRPFGVFSGKLDDVDDASKFGCVAEIKTAAIGLVYHKHHFATCNFAGDVAISADFGETWHKESLAKMYKYEPFDSYADVTGLAYDGSIYYGNLRIKFK